MPPCRSWTASVDSNPGRIALVFSDLAYPEYRFTMPAQGRGHGIRPVGGNDDDHANAAVEYPVHFMIRHAAVFLEPAEQGRHIPGIAMQGGSKTGTQHTRNVLKQPAAGDMGQTFDVAAM